MASEWLSVLASVGMAVVSQCLTGQGPQLQVAEQLLGATTGVS